MSSLVIVALPAEDDYVNKISSEEAPHCTLLYLGEDAMRVPNVTKMIEFVEHAVDVWERGPFMLEVERRGTLGEDEADVLFFKKNYSCQQLEKFRWQLLQNTPIRTAYDKAPQFDGEWIPHLTLGYPATPAKEDKRDFPGIRWVDFDRIALWFGANEGPEFPLEWGYDDYDLAEVGMSTTTERGEEFILHYGVKGMRWGVRKERTVTVQSRPDQGILRRQTKVATKGGHAHEATDDAIRAAVSEQKLKRSGAAALSNQELRDLATRKQLEEQVTILTSKKGKRFVRRQLTEATRGEAERQIRRGVSTAVKLAV